MNSLGPQGMSIFLRRLLKANLVLGGMVKGCIFKHFCLNSSTVTFSVLNHQNNSIIKEIMVTYIEEEGVLSPTKNIDLDLVKLIVCFRLPHQPQILAPDYISFWSVCKIFCLLQPTPHVVYLKCVTYCSTLIHKQHKKKSNPSNVKQQKMQFSNYLLQIVTMKVKHWQNTQRQRSVYTVEMAVRLEFVHFTNIMTTLFVAQGELTFFVLFPPNVKKTQIKS